MEEVFTIAEDAELSEEDVTALNDHFHQFVSLRDAEKKLVEGYPCVGCGKPFHPNLVQQLMDNVGFTWGLAHGYGHCRNCHWPGQAHHNIKSPDGTLKLTLHNVPLQVHPDLVEVPPK